MCKEKGKHTERGVKLERSRLQQWKKMWNAGDSTAFSMEEQRCCTLHRQRFVSVWALGEEGSFGGEPSSLCWDGRIPLVPLAILEEKCLLRTSIVKTAGGLLYVCRVFSCGYLNRVLIPVSCKMNVCIGAVFLSQKIDLVGGNFEILIWLK